MRENLMSIQQRGRREPRGSVLVEAGLVISLILVPLLLGVTVYGFNLIRILQANQINRDAGHMFARGVDLSGSASGLVNQAILFKMSPRLQTTTTSGSAVLILSSVKYIGKGTCTGCSNQYHVVFTSRIVLGNSALKASAFGTVPFGSVNTDGTIKTPLDDNAVRADGITPYIVLADGETAYVSETYLSSSDLAIPGFPSPAGTYTRAFF